MNEYLIIGAPLLIAVIYSLGYLHGAKMATRIGIKKMDELQEFHMNNLKQVYGTIQRH